MLLDYFITAISGRTKKGELKSELNVWCPCLSQDNLELILWWLRYRTVSKCKCHTTAVGVRRAQLEAVLYDSWCAISSIERHLFRPVRIWTDATTLPHVNIENLPPEPLVWYSNDWNCCCCFVAEATNELPDRLNNPPMIVTATIRLIGARNSQ